MSPLRTQVPARVAVYMSGGEPISMADYKTGAQAVSTNGDTRTAQSPHRWKIFGEVPMDFTAEVMEINGEVPSVWLSKYTEEGREKLATGETIQPVFQFETRDRLLNMVNLKSFIILYKRVHGSKLSSRSSCGCIFHDSSV
jgi:hypothetical protein